MSEIETHYGATVPACNPRYPGLVPLVQDWAEVTCGACKLEQPMQQVPGRVEYRTPEHVRAQDVKHTEEDRAGGFLAETLPRAALLQRRLAKAKALEGMAVEVLAHWARTLAEATALREAAERELSALLPGGQASGVPAVGVAGPKGSQSFSAGLQGVGRALRAPVNAVDIRTEDGYAEGMADKLSDNAKSALINVSASASGVVTAARSELEAAGMVGRSGRMTRRGSIMRQRLVQAAEDEAFG